MSVEKPGACWVRPIWLLPNMDQLRNGSLVKNAQIAVIVTFPRHLDLLAMTDDTNIYLKKLYKRSCSLHQQKPAVRGLTNPEQRPRRKMLHS